MRSGQITPVHAPPIYFPKLLTCDSPQHPKCCAHTTYSASCFKQLSVLLKRTFIILSRDRTLTYSRFITHTLIAIFIGILYYGIGTDASNMLNNFNFMFFSVMFLMLTSFNCIITTCKYCFSKRCFNMVARSLLDFSSHVVKLTSAKFVVNCMAGKHFLV